MAVTFDPCMVAMDPPGYPALPSKFVTAARPTERSRESIQTLVRPALNRRRFFRSDPVGLVSSHCFFPSDRLLVIGFSSHTV
jgi:hypothetical protein